ncbi:MAG: hypothetical protein H6910_02640 [Rickettsiaceae bacterium]|nr:hypothetical protein [Rickettsiaceae bacterium]
MNGKYNNSKSALILQKYKPEDIQKLLNSGEFKSVIVCTLGVNMKAFNEYMRQHNLTYKPPKKPRISSNQKQNIKKGQKDSSPYQEPLERFKKLFEERKQKRTLQELKDSYY